MPRPMNRDRRRRPRLEPLEGRALLASLMVTNALDSGAGSLRQAITDADAATGPSTIGFAIPGAGVHTINLTSPLPAIYNPLTIDGTTQAGYAGTPVVALDGPSQVPTGGSIPSPAPGLEFTLSSDQSVVKGLAIDRFGGPGIEVGGPRVTIEQNYIGVDPSGQAAGNGTGIEVSDLSAAPTGSTPPQGIPGKLIMGNVIGDNGGDGIDLIGALGVTITGNFIGTDAAGTAALGNALDGIFADSATTTSTASGNTISNNGRAGIVVQSGGGLTSTGNIQTNNGALVANLAVVASTPNATANGVSALTGQTITTTYTVTNDGPNTATGVTLGVGSRFSRLNAGTTYRPSPIFTITGATASQGTIGFTAPLSPGSEVASLGTLAPGASATVTVTSQVIGSGQDSLDAFASSDQTTTVAPGPAASTSINAIGNADIAVVSSASPAVPLVGQPETFTFVVTNHDPSYSIDALFALQFGPTAAIAREGVLVSQGTVMALPAFASGYGGDLGRLAPGGSATVTAVIIPPAGGVVSAALYAYSAANIDPAPSNNLAFAAVRALSGPSVVAVVAQPGSSAPITGVELIFDSPLNASQAQNVNNYRLTTGTGARVSIASATYTAATNVVTLRLARSLPTTGTPLQLVVSGSGATGLTGINGSKLVNAGITLTVPR